MRYSLLALTSALFLSSTISAELIRVTLQRAVLEPNKNATAYPDSRPKYRMRQSIAHEHLDAYMKDIAYYGTIEVGNPSRRFRVDFDTGSANTWISSTLCESTACLGHHRYDPNESTSFRNDGRRFLVRYGDGSSVSGQLGIDDISIGGIALQGQPFGMAQYESDDMDDNTIDGIMGLAFPALSAVHGVPTVLESMIQQRLLDAPVFSFLLSRGVSGDDSGTEASTPSTGEIIFGGVDPTRFVHPMRYAPLTRALYWQFHLEDVVLDGHSLRLSADAVVDTGTSLIVVPNNVARVIHAQIPGAVFSTTSGWLIPCNLSGSGPDLEFAMAGGKSVVPSADYVGPPLTQNVNMCFSNIMNSDVEHWILGDTFLKNNYVMFDYGMRRIGFAQRSDDFHTHKARGFPPSPPKRGSLARGNNGRARGRPRNNPRSQLEESSRKVAASTLTRRQATPLMGQHPPKDTTLAVL